jgi:four helix bundle protein
MEFSFRNLDVWKKSLDLSISVYQHTTSVKDFGFKAQISRCSLSVPSNIAEGYSRQTPKETVQFLFIARGSCAELETQCLI